MAELREVSGDVVYRPLSGLAVAGFAVSCLFGGVVAISALLAILQGAPFFFSDWSLLIAVGGFLLSWWGLNDIRNSEGTKAGLKLATWGMWVSVVTGAGYFAYSYFTRLALQQQAIAFFMKEDDDYTGFFPRLQKAGQESDEAKRLVELNGAFLLTLPANERVGIRPEDEEKLAQSFDKGATDASPGNLSRFRMDHVVLGLVKGGAAASVESLGIQEWKYEKKSYNVTCLFRIKVPEADVDLAVTAMSSEGEREGQSRRWFLNFNTLQNGVMNFTRTKLGEGLRTLRASGLNYLRTWEPGLQKGEKLVDFERVDATAWAKFEPSLPAETRSKLKAQLKDIFQGAAAGDNAWHVNVGMEVGASAWERDAKGRLQLTLPFSIMMNPQGGFDTHADGFAVVQTKDSVDPESFVPSDRTLTMPAWELKQLKFTRYRQGKRGP